MISSAYSWLVHQGNLYSNIVEWVVAFILGYLVRGLLVRSIADAWHEHMSTQREIADKLDPDTPGGIGRLPELVTSALDEREQRGRTQP